MANEGEQSRIQKGKIFVLFAMLVALAVTIFIYLNWTSYTTLSTRLITTAVTSIVFTIGYGISSKWRCASWIFLTQLLSPFGVLIVFDTFSWFLLVLPNFEAIVEIMTRIQTSGQFCTYERNHTLTNTQILLGSLHYLPLGAFALVFLFCICTVIFYEPPNTANVMAGVPTYYTPGVSPPIATQQQTTREKSTKFLRLLNGIGDLLKHCQFAVFILSVTLVRWRASTVIAINKLLEQCQDQVEYSPMNSILFTTYLIVSGICVIVLLFAPKSTSRRDQIIREFNQKVQQKQLPSVYFLRPKAVPPVIVHTRTEEMEEFEASQEAYAAALTFGSPDPNDPATSSNNYQQ